MTRTRRLAIAATVLLTGLLGASAGAATVEECKSMIDLISITGQYNFDTATLAELTSKQEAASLALVQSDFPGAKSDLEALRAKVTELSKTSPPAIPAEAARRLLQDVDSALGCVWSLIDR